MFDSLVTGLCKDLWAKELTLPWAKMTQQKVPVCLRILLDQVALSGSVEG